MFNMQNLMQQVQKMQQQAAKMQDELEEMTFTGTAGGGVIEVDVTGQASFKTIRLKPEAINPEHPESVSKETIELLEDMISSAINDANMKAAKVAKEKLSKVSAGINIPGISNSPLMPKTKPPKEAKGDDFGDLGGFGNLLG